MWNSGYEKLLCQTKLFTLNIQKIISILMRLIFISKLFDGSNMFVCLFVLFRIFVNAVH